LLLIGLANSVSAGRYKPIIHAKPPLLTGLCEPTVFDSVDAQATHMPVGYKSSYCLIIFKKNDNPLISQNL
jgi:hypothetical protein